MTFRLDRGAADEQDGPKGHIVLFLFKSGS